MPREDELVRVLNSEESCWKHDQSNLACIRIAVKLPTKLRRKHILWRLKLQRLPATRLSFVLVSTSFLLSAGSRATQSFKWISTSLLTISLGLLPLKPRGKANHPKWTSPDHHFYKPRHGANHPGFEAIDTK